MNTFIVNERPLNDDMLYIADRGKVFKGGYIALLEYYTFANAWSDRKHRRGFKSLEAMRKFITKRYPDFNEEVFQS